MKCKRCGQCCIKLVSKLMWIDNLNYEEKQILVAKRKEYPELKIKACGMLYFIDGIAYCLVHKVFGKNKKPTACQNYMCSRPKPSGKVGGSK